jgi:hypothetical protein
VPSKLRIEEQAPKEYLWRHGPPFEEANDPKTELKIAVVTPLISFALAVVFWRALVEERTGPLSGTATENSEDRPDASDSSEGAGSTTR